MFILNCFSTIQVNLIQCNSLLKNLTVVIPKIWKPFVLVVTITFFQKPLINVLYFSSSRPVKVEMFWNKIFTYNVYRLF